MHLNHVDGVMVGRAAYQNPAILADVDRMIFGVTDESSTRAEVLRAIVPYVEEHLSRGGRLSNVTRHVLGLYHGQPRGKVFRRHLSEKATDISASADVLHEAIALVEFHPGRDDQSCAA
jgi:tRNA-dihydrouridine synthase A